MNNRHSNRGGKNARTQNNTAVRVIHHDGRRAPHGKGRLRVTEHFLQPTMPRKGGALSSVDPAKVAAIFATKSDPMRTFGNGR